MKEFLFRLFGGNVGLNSTSLLPAIATWKIEIEVEFIEAFLLVKFQ